MSPRRSAAATVEDYLKAIHNAQEWTDAPVTSARVAERVGVGASTVSETLRRLTARGLVEHARYGAVALTPEGRRLALRQVRRHRLLETWLVEQLGYGWDEVHEEAEELEHAVSDRFVARLDVLLGHPRSDPHGDPIPDDDGHVNRPTAVLIAELPPDRPARVVRVSDADPAVLRSCAAAHVVPGAVVVPTDVPTGVRDAVYATPDV